MRKRAIIKTIVNAAATAATGTLCLVLGHEMIRYLILFCGIFLLTSALMEFTFNREFVIGTVKLILAFLAISMAWNPITVAVVLYLFGLTLAIYGGLGVLQIVVNRSAGIRPTFGEIVRPILHLALGILLFLNQTGIVDAVFVFCGILLILRAAMTLFSLTGKD